MLSLLNAMTNEQTETDVGISVADPLGRAGRYLAKAGVNASSPKRDLYAAACRGVRSHRPRAFSGTGFYSSDGGREVPRKYGAG